MSSTENSTNIPSTTTAEVPVGTELDNLVSQLRQTINKSDWLTRNTSAKWEQDNPELAKQWRQALQPNPPNDTTQQ